MNHDSPREITAALKELGYRFVSLDLEGYRSGSADGAAAGD